MSGSSLIKFANRTTSDGRKLFWDRADLDGYPFRGAAAPMLTQDEWDEKVVRVADPRNGFFEVTESQQNAEFLHVLDGIANGWFQLIHIQRFVNETMKHYVEWVEFYLEDGTRTPFMSPGVMELNNAQSHPGSNLLSTGINGQTH